MLFIQRPKTLLRAVQEHTQIVAVHTKLAADLVFFLFLQEEGPEQPSVLVWELLKHLAHLLAGLPGHEEAVEVGGLIRWVRHGSVLLIRPRGGPIVLEQHIVAYRVNEGSEAIRGPDARFAAHRGQDADKSLLLDVVNH